MSLKVSLIGAPTDVGAGIRGTHMGPAALRGAGLGRKLQHLVTEVIDRGDLPGPDNPEQPAMQGYRHLNEVVAWNALVHEAVGTELRRGYIPMVLGGDHSLGIGSVSAAARYCREMGRDIRVLWFDAHTDFNTATSSPSANIHGMPIACLCGEGPDGLVHIGESTATSMDPSVFRLIGVRSVDDGEKSRVQIANLPVFDMDMIDRHGLEAIMKRALEGVGEQTHIHVSFDVDVLDPSIAPGVSTPARGGLNYREARLCLERVAHTGRLGSVDLVELNPARDNSNSTTEVTVSLAASLFGEEILGIPSL